MKILLTGGGTGGHFYPLIAIAEEIQKIADERKLLEPTIYYMSTTPYDEKVLRDRDIVFRKVSAGKRRMYFSVRNFFDIFVMAWGVVRAFWKVFAIYPDIVISKGGYASVPATTAAFLLRIPVIVHESDSVPGRANKRAGRFAKRIAVSWPEAAQFFPPDKVAVTGQPIRGDVAKPIAQGAYEYLRLEEQLPVILILGGSQGAQKINEAILGILPDLITKYQVIHQVGANNVETVKGMAGVVLDQSEHKERYKPFAYLNPLALRMSAGVATLVISRAGSTIFEIASWGVPSIMIPLLQSNGDHQRKNAFNYSRVGAALVIGENNLTPNVLRAEIDRLIADEPLRARMATAAKGFYQEGAARKIAEEVIDIALRHEN